MAGGMCGGGCTGEGCVMGRGGAWQERQALQRTERILLEYILVKFKVVLTTRFPFARSPLFLRPG